MKTAQAVRNHAGMVAIASSISRKGSAKTIRRKIHQKQDDQRRRVPQGVDIESCRQHRKTTLASTQCSKETARNQREKQRPEAEAQCAEQTDDQHPGLFLSVLVRTDDIPPQAPPVPAMLSHFHGTPAESDSKHQDHHCQHYI